MGKELTNLLERTVLSERTGRVLARAAAYLIGEGQDQVQEVYSRVKNREVIEEASPATAKITSRTGRKRKISQSAAIKWYIETHPKQSIPLQRKLRERVPVEPRNVFSYGLKDGEDFSDDDYVQIISEAANVPIEYARSVYMSLIKPMFSEPGERSRVMHKYIKGNSE